MDRAGDHWSTTPGGEDSAQYYPQYRHGDARRLGAVCRQDNGLTYSYLPGASSFELHHGIDHGGQHLSLENSLAAIPISRYHPVAQVPHDLHHVEGYLPSTYHSTSPEESYGMQQYDGISPLESGNKRRRRPQISNQISNHPQDVISIFRRGGALTPPPTDYLQSYHQGPATMGTRAQDNEMTPPGASPEETGVFQYQEEDQMDDFGDLGIRSAFPTMRTERPLLRPDVQRRIDETEAEERLRNRLRREQAQREAQQPTYGMGMPVQQNYGFLPNHVVGRPFPSSSYSGTPMSKAFSGNGPFGTPHPIGGYGYTSDCSAYVRAANSSSHPTPNTFGYQAPSLSPYATPNPPAYAPPNLPDYHTANPSLHPAMDPSNHPAPLTDSNGIPVWQIQQPTYNPPSIPTQVHTPFTDIHVEGHSVLDEYNRLKSMSLPNMNTNKVPLTREQENAILLRRRAEGRSFRDIAMELDMEKREATLRGRYRALTKPKEERVRAPKWKDIDNFLLRDCVEKKGGLKVRSEAELNRAGIPWKEVAKYIKRNGGSYEFGAATVKKQYVKLYCNGSRESEEDDVDDDDDDDDDDDEE